MNVDGMQFDGDALPDAYDVLVDGVKRIKGVPGLTCEIGVRAGLGSALIMNTCQANDDKRIHVGIDPWGNIDIVLGERIVTADYTNGMKREALKKLYEWCYNHGQELYMFAMTDTEFFELFAEGIPVHDNGVSLKMNEYAYVFIDGPHNNAAVQAAIEFFEPKSPVGAVWQFDNCDAYGHDVAHKWVLEHGFKEFTDEIGIGGLCFRRSYARISK